MTQSAKSDRPQVFSGWARRSIPRTAAASAFRHAEEIFARAGFSDATLVIRWPEIAGLQVARVAEPLRCQPGPEGAVLTLKCEPGAVVFLQHETRAIIERLNAYLGSGRIARVRLVSGRLLRMPELPDHPGLDRREQPAAECARTVADALTALDATRAWQKRRGGQRTD